MHPTDPPDAATPAPRPVLSPAEELLCELALALHGAGAPAHRLEDVVGGLAGRMDVEARVFSTPTSIYVGFGAPAHARTTLLRVGPGALDLGRLDAVDAIVRRLAAGELDLAGARAALGSLSGAPRRYGLIALLPAYAAASGTVAVLFGGGWPELVAGALTGLIVGGVVEAIARRRALAPLGDLIGAFASGLFAGGLARLGLATDVALVTLAGIIVLVPGLSLTTAMTELGTRHLSSGTARLGGVMATFAALALGAVAGGAIWVAIPAPVPASAPLGPIATVVALLVAIPSFTLLLQARLADLWVIALAAIAGYLTATSLAGIVPTPFDATLGALAVGLVANLSARLRDRPAAVPLVPGLFLLVPGSIGFRSLLSLFSADVTGGLDDAVRAGLTAVGLAAGVIVANVALPARRPL